MSSILERIERDAGIPGLSTLLAERLSPSDLQSLLLETYRLRAQRRTPKQLLDEYANSRFVRPATVDPRLLTAFESLAWQLLPDGFEAVALAPVAPLGTCSVVASVDQNRAVATIRNAEVVSDSTNVLALECALRRRQMLQADARSATPVHLAASHRLLRPQQYASKNLSAHFSLFGLCSARRDQGTLRFELPAVADHLRFYLAAVSRFTGDRLRFQVKVTDFASTPRMELLETGLLTPLRSEFPGCEFAFEAEREMGKGYYHDVAFHLFGISGSGERLFLADGGCVDWTQKLLSSTKERLVISGIGIERLCQFRTAENTT